MSRRFAVAAAVVVLATATFSAQTRRRPARRAAPAVKTVTPEMQCPSPLGVGVKSGASYCDVLTGRDPAAGVLIKVPPHRGPATLTFNLHNRETYSAEQVRAKRAYARYTATIGVLTMDNTLISRAVVQNEFRTAADLVERIGGGAGPSGLKAVAPTGTEPITITIPQQEDEVSLLGEKLTVDRIDGTATYSSPGRPIAVISDVKLQYRPGPAPRKRKKD